MEVFVGSLEREAALQMDTHRIILNGHLLGQGEKDLQTYMYQDELMALPRSIYVPHLDSTNTQILGLPGD